MTFRVFGALSLWLIALSGCSDTIPRDRPSDTLVGAASGTVIGAGAGAIVGGTVSGLEVGSSALVGGGAGLVVGAATGYAVARISEENTLEARDELIASNREALDRRAAAIEALRAEVEAETRAIHVDRSRGEYRFSGETLGNPYR